MKTKFEALCLVPLIALGVFTMVNLDYWVNLLVLLGGG